MNALGKWLKYFSWLSVLFLEWRGFVCAYNQRAPSPRVHLCKKLTAYDIDNEIESWYARCSQAIKCPFFKRRTADILDAASNIFQFLVARHKSVLPLSFIDQDYKYHFPPGCRSSGEQKKEGLSMSEIMSIIEKDWNVNISSDIHVDEDEVYGKNKGYYITGKLTRSIYRDNCFFDGPDPDMPVIGLRKYLAASSQLFDRKKSTCELKCIKCNEINRVISVQWKLQGVLNLPWHPRLKPYTGSTHYHVDVDGLIAKHVEEWDITMLHAFVCTLLPAFSIVFDDRKLRIPF